MRLSRIGGLLHRLCPLPVCVFGILFGRHGYVRILDNLIFWIRPSQIPHIPDTWPIIILKSGCLLCWSSRIWKAGFLGTFHPGCKTPRCPCSVRGQPLRWAAKLAAPACTHVPSAEVQVSWTGNFTYGHRDPQPCPNVTKIAHEDCSFKARGLRPRSPCEGQNLPCL